MTLQIIGAGLGRTGTLTLKTALQQLGFGPCHHMLEVMARPEEQMPLWCRAAEGLPVDWEEVFAGFRSSVDWPSAHFYKQLAARYPDARVILTRRDPDSWYESMSETILKIMASRPIPPAADDPGRFLDLIVGQQTFAYDYGRANVIAAFERHNAEVVNSIAPERLLVFEAAQGWEPLCDFLGRDIPATPFPRRNSSEEFWSHPQNATQT